MLVFAIPVAAVAVKALVATVCTYIAYQSLKNTGKVILDAIEDGQIATPSFAKENSKSEAKPADKPKDEPSPMPEEGSKSGNEGYKTPPKELPGVPDAQPSKPKTPKQGGNSGKRKRWKDSDGNIYEWDYQHGDVEKYDKRGKHKGSINPNTGEQTKPPVKGRTVEP